MLFNLRKKLVAFGVALLLCLWEFPAICQKSFIPILLPDSLKIGAREFSSLEIAHNRLYLLGENRFDHFKMPTAGLYSIPLSELDECIRSPDRMISDFQYHLLEGVDWAAQHIEGYQGLEALVIEGTRFYVTVETDVTEDSCFLLTGTIDHDIFKLDTTQIVAIPKPSLSDGSQVFNAGFESLLFSKGVLYTLYEFNNFKKNYILRIDPFTQSVRRITLNRAIPFRTTDLAKWKRKKIIGLNYFFPLKAEQIYSTDLSASDRRLISENDTILHPFARLSLFKLTKKRMKLVRYIDLPTDLWTSNWEGIVRYKNGALIVNDKYINNGGRETRLIYLTLD